MKEKSPCPRIAADESERVQVIKFSVATGHIISRSAKDICFCKFIIIILAVGRSLLTKPAPCKAVVFTLYFSVRDPLEYLSDVTAIGSTSFVNYNIYYNYQSISASTTSLSVNHDSVASESL